MIKSLSDLYARISTQLPGVSTAVLDNEFREAERRVCSDTGIWCREDTITTVADTYEYTLVLPANTDLVTSLVVKDTNDNIVDVNKYTVEFEGASNQDGYSVETLFGAVDDAVEGNYTDSGETFNGAVVYKNAAYALYKAVAGIDEDSSLYILTIEAQYADHVADNTVFPPDYYTAAPPISAYYGLLDGEGAYEGRVQSIQFEEKASVVYTFDEPYIDGLSTYGAFPVVNTLMPRSGFSAAPDTVLTQYSDLLISSALAELLRYPRNFPWSDPIKAERVDQKVRRLSSRAKYERFRPNKRATLVMGAQSFI